MVATDSAFYRGRQNIHHYFYRRTINNNRRILNQLLTMSMRKKIVISIGSFILTMGIITYAVADLRTLIVPQGGSGFSSTSPNALIASGTTTIGALVATSSPTIGYITATLVL